MSVGASSGGGGAEALAASAGSTVGSTAAGEASACPGPGYGTSVQRIGNISGPNSMLEITIDREGADEGVGVE